MAFYHIGYDLRPRRRAVSLTWVWSLTPNLSVGRGSPIWALILVVFATMSDIVAYRPWVVNPVVASGKIFVL